jgi:hypothetical protein
MATKKTIAIVKRERRGHRVVEHAPVERLPPEASTPETLHLKFRGGRRIEARAEHEESVLIAPEGGSGKVVLVSHEHGTIIGEQG